MKTSKWRMMSAWRQLTLCMVVAIMLVACGRGEASTPEAAAPTTAPTAAAPAETPAEEAEETETEEAEAAEESNAAQAESPLAQPESPLAQPESPLTMPMTAPRTEADAEALAAITHAAAPSAGMGTIAGVVYSFGAAPGAIRGTQVYLEAADEVEGKFYPPAVSLGPSVEAGDVIVETNEYGQLFMEVPPGNYYAAVWTPYDWRLVVEEIGEEAPRLITIEEGDQLDLGVLLTYWP